MQKYQYATSRTRPEKTLQLLSVLFPGLPALKKVNSHIVRTLKQSMEKSTGQGTEASCQQPALTWQPPKIIISEADPPAQDKPSGDYRPGWILTITSWDTISKNHADKLLPNSWPTEIVQDNTVVLRYLALGYFFMQQHITDTGSEEEEIMLR